MIRKGLLRLLCLVTVVGLLSGCGRLLHNLQPHRLQRLNRHPPIGEGAMYSVSDDVPVRPSAARPGGVE